jgi:hypothetical protein
MHVLSFKRQHFMIEFSSADNSKSDYSTRAKAVIVESWPSSVYASDISD